MNLVTLSILDVYLLSFGGIKDLNSTLFSPPFSLFRRPAVVYIGSVGNYNRRFFARESLQTLEATVQDIVCLFICRETSRKSGTEGVYSERTRKEVIYQESVLSKLKIFFVEGNVLCKKTKRKENWRLARAMPRNI